MRYKFKNRSSKRLSTLPLLLVVALSFFSINSYAKLTQSIDRTNIHAGESFLLTLQVDEDTGAQPDLSLIPKEFTILSNSQYQNMSFINGISSITKGWKIKLSTLVTGKITIPPITVGKEKSTAINLFIKDTSNKIDIAGQKKAIYLEATVDHSEVYVQQQIIFTIKLYRAINTHYARLTEPDAGESIVEKLADDIQYTANIGNTPYSITERRYAIFPQQSGKFLSSTRPISVNSKSIDITVLPQPKKASNPWIPASEVILVDKWSNGGSELTVGEPVTWTILLYAQGLSESQLPEVLVPKVKGLQFYPDTAQKERQINDKGVLGQRIEKLAVIPSEVGTITIPEVRVNWWDTNSKSEKTATIPARTFTVLAGEKSANASPDIEKIGPEVKTIKVVDTVQLMYWKSATIIFISLWLITLLFYLRNRRSGSTLHNRDKSSRAKQIPIANDSELRKRLSKALKNNSLSDTEALLLKWSSHIAQADFRSLGQLAARLENENVILKLRDLDANRYSNNHPTPSSLDEPNAIDTNDLRIIEQELSRSVKDNPAEAIPPLYPSRRNQ